MTARRVVSEDIKPPLVPPALAGLLSLVLPGLGHVLIRSYRRGLLLFFGLATIVGLLAWRIALVGRREAEPLDKALKAFQLKPILLAVAIAVAVLYLWIAVDAVIAGVRRGRGAGLGMWAAVLLVYFALGWQIGDINLVTLLTESKDAAPLMLRIAWPWDRAIYREPQHLVATANIQIPCVGTPPAPPQEIEGQPYLGADPTCGNLSVQGGEPGTRLAVIGRNFAPQTRTEIWWRDDMGNEFRQRQAGDYLAVTTDEQGSFRVEIVIPYRTIPPSETREFSIWQLEARQLEALGEPQLSSEFLLAVEKMVETIFLGMMATFFAIVLSIPVSFLAARNLMSASWLTLAIYYLVRTLLNIVRSIEPLIWAVIAIIVVGLGPFAGIVALTVHSIAALGKLYSEAIESIDPGPIEAIQATGANWLQTVVYGVIPQVIPPFVSFTIYRWDINVRMSTVIGLVGGGGIGYLLIQWIHLLDYKAAGIAVWFITVTVAVLDFVSSEIRQRFV